MTDDAGVRPALTDLAFHILIALGNGAAHGYAIGKDVDEQCGGRLDPSTGTLYQALHPAAAALQTEERKGGTCGRSDTRDSPRVTAIST